MEIKITINDKLINLLKKVFSKKNGVFIIAAVIFCGGLLIFSQQVELDTFHDGDIIYAGPINDNFRALRDRELGSLADVDIGGAGDGQVLKYNGTSWAPGNDIGGDGGVWGINGSNIYYTGGNVGIGTNNPTGVLHLYTSVKDDAVLLDMGTYTTPSRFQLRLIGTDSDLLKFSSAGTDLMTIANTGNVGIGTTSPGKQLSIMSPSNNLIEFTPGVADTVIYVNNVTAGGKEWRINSTGNATGTGMGGGKLAFYTGSPYNNLVLDGNTGNIGIGTTDPTSKLQVKGLPIYADNAAAISGGLTAGAFYHNGDGIVRVVY